MNFWTKSFKKEISFNYSLFILITFFFISTLIIYYTTVVGQAESYNNNDLAIIKTKIASYQDQGKYLIITSPRPRDQLGKNFILSGSAQLNSGRLYYRIINQQAILLQGNIILNNNLNQPTLFNTEVSLGAEPLADSGTVELYVLDNLTSTEKRLLEIPIKFY